MGTYWEVKIGHLAVYFELGLFVKSTVIELCLIVGFHNDFDEVAHVLIFLG